MQEDSNTSTELKKEAKAMNEITAAVETGINLDPVQRLTRDLKQAAFGLSRNEARYLVDAYYQIQEYRKAAANQFRSLAESEEPNSVIGWLFHQHETLEGQIKRALDAWTDQQVVGKWAKSITGIGPVIAAGLLAHIDINKAPTCGHIWRFAGLEPTVEWVGREQAKKMFDVVADELLNEEGVEKDNLYDIATRLAVRAHRKPENLIAQASQDRDGQSITMTKASLLAAFSRRPWNAQLKTLCWKIGESFVKVSGNDSDYYGKLYLKRKAQETADNEVHKFADQAKAKLERFNIGKGTEAYKAYTQGMLPPAHIHARAKRYAVKLFLSHYHHASYRLELKQEPPKPYVIEHLGHVHFLPPPNLQ